MKQLNQTKLTTKKFLLMLGILVAGFQGQAQVAHKVGDNLGNHLATQDLDLTNHDILNAKIVNASGMVIGIIGSTPFDPTNVSLQLEGNKAILINRVDNLLTTPVIASPVDGMMVYNNTDGRFYFRNNKHWETFMSSPSGQSVWTINPDIVGKTPNAYGLTLVTTGGNVVVNLEAATKDFPGVVTTAAQAFAGDKSFSDAVNIAGAVNLPGVVASSSSTDIADQVLVVDASSGLIKKSTLVSGMINRQVVTVPPNTCPAFPGKSNMSYTFIVSVTGVSIDDGVVVNFQNDDAKYFTGLTIKSARASDVGNVTIELEDNQNPTNADYKFPQFDTRRLIVTYLHKVLLP